ncbi:MAG: hypothetical protein KAS32_18900 [Candidatus Peribacteraceae bacterium]|nr:hypothetical protein [Candidatus Peribacteraceae bacterium]
MQIEIDDFLDDLCEKYPHFTRDSIEKICRKGLFKLNTFLKDSNEIRMRARQDEEVRIFIPMSPEMQQKHSTKKYYQKLKKKELNEQKKRRE